MFHDVVQVSRNRTRKGWRNRGRHAESWHHPAPVSACRIYSSPSSSDSIHQHSFISLLWINHQQSRRHIHRELSHFLITKWTVLAAKDSRKLTSAMDKPISSVIKATIHVKWANGILQHDTLLGLGCAFAFISATLQDVQNDPSDTLAKEINTRLFLSAIKMLKQAMLPKGLLFLYATVIGH